MVRPNLESAYVEMAKEKKREKEAMEWAEATFREVASGQRYIRYQPF
ncbi:MAG: hypothetical protein WA974_16850 [Thermodesulfobacteriota bacterium]